MKLLLFSIITTLFLSLNVRGEGIKSVFSTLNSEDCSSLETVNKIKVWLDSVHQDKLSDLQRKTEVIRFTKPYDDFGYTLNSIAIESANIEKRADQFYYTNFIESCPSVTHQK